MGARGDTGGSVIGNIWRGTAALLVVLVAPSSPARADGFRLERLYAAERSDDGFGVRRIGRFGHLSPGALATLSFAHDPLVIEAVGSRREVRTLVSRQLTLALALSLGLWDRLLVHAVIEAVPWMDGPRAPVGFAVPSADGAGLGDLALGARVRLLGDAEDLFALAAQVALGLPTAGTQAYRGERGVSARPELIAELRPRPVRVTLSVGALARPRERLLDARVGSELSYGLAAGVRVHRMVELLAELTGALGFEDFGTRESAHLEWRAGGKVSTPHGLYVGAAAGTGLTNAVGSPDARVVAQLGFLSQSRPRVASAPVAPVNERAAEPDPDGDQVRGASDACPELAEDRDGFEDADGCPERDDDGDGVPDASDGCPAEAEDRDGFEDADGCPERDDDGDGVPDVDDACRTQAGVAEERGCPPKAALTEAGAVTITEQIHFETDQAVILPESFATLASVRAILAAHPEIVRLRVEGHTDRSGPAAKNMQLSMARAAAVAAWLVERGIARERVVAYGCGERHPLGPTDAEASRAEDRRVVFQVVHAEPGKPGSRAPSGCQLVTGEP